MNDFNEVAMIIGYTFMGLFLFVCSGFLVSIVWGLIELGYKALKGSKTP